MARRSVCGAAAASPCAAARSAHFRWNWYRRSKPGTSSDSAAYVAIRCASTCCAKVSFRFSIVSSPSWGNILSAPLRTGERTPAAAFNHAIGGGA